MRSPARAPCCPVCWNAIKSCLPGAQCSTARTYCYCLPRPHDVHNFTAIARVRAHISCPRWREEAQRQAFREHAEAESRRILEEQKKQDAEWRAAVAEVGKWGQQGRLYESMNAR